MGKNNYAAQVATDEEKKKTQEIKPEKEIDADEEVHKNSPDLIQKEDHHLPVDDEVKNG
jgi:hypothetical protein